MLLQNFFPLLDSICYFSHLALLLLLLQLVSEVLNPLSLRVVSLLHQTFFLSPQVD